MVLHTYSSCILLIMKTTHALCQVVGDVMLVPHGNASLSLYLILVFGDTNSVEYMEAFTVLDGVFSPAFSF